MNRPEENLLQLDNNLYAGRPQRFSLHAGAQLDVKRYANPRRPVYVTPNFLYTSQAQFQQLNLGPTSVTGSLPWGAGTAMPLVIQMVSSRR